MNALTIDYLGGEREQFISDSPIKLLFDPERMTIRAAAAESETRFFDWRFVKCLASEGAVVLCP